MKAIVLTLFYCLVGLSLTAQSTLDPDLKCIPSIDTLDGMQVYKTVDQVPLYEGGMHEFYKDFTKLVNTQKQQRIGLDDKFVFTFAIDTLGNIRNFCLVKPKIDILIKSDSLTQLNKWTPGSQNGKKVPARMILPLYVCFK